MEVGKRIRDLRRQRGISLRDLARRSGVSKAYLSQLENDPARKPSVDVVLRIAAALQVNLSDLLGPLVDVPGVTGSGPGAGGPVAGSSGGSARLDDPAAPQLGAAADPIPATEQVAAPPRFLSGAVAGAGGPAAAAGTVERAPVAGGIAPVMDSRAGFPDPGPPGASGDPLGLERLPWALRVFWQEHPEVPEEDIRSLATITWRGRRPFTPTDYWVLHQVLTGMTRGV